MRTDPKIVNGWVRPVVDRSWEMTRTGPTTMSETKIAMPIANRMKKARRTFRQGNSPAGGQASSAGHQLGRGREWRRCQRT